MDNNSEQNEHEVAQARLKPVHEEAVKLRLKGMQYTYIAETLVMEGYKVKEHTIRTWFMRGGVCHQFFISLQLRSHETVNERLEYGKYLLAEMALDAIGVLRAAVNGYKISWQQLRAAQDILDRAGFPKYAPIQMHSLPDYSKKDASNEIANSLKAIAESLNPKF